MFGSNRLIALCIVIAFALSGCVGDTDDDDGTTSTSGGTGAADDCEMCASILWFCECELDSSPGDWIFHGSKCTSGEPIVWCQTLCDLENDKLYKAPCSDHDASGSCSGWDPASEISVVAGVYHVDQGFIASLAADAAPLWTCDDAVVEAASAWFEIADADAGELLYELGLRDGDIPYTINGMALASYDDAIRAYQQLYLGDESEYELWVQRGEVFVLLEYELD